MGKEDNLKKFSSEYQPEKNGRPKGSRNRSTIIREWLQVEQKFKNPITGKEEILEQQDIMTLALIKKAREGDVSAYRELMDGCYGKIDNNVKLTGDLTTNNLLEIDYTKMSIDELNQIENIALRYLKNPSSESTEII